MKKEGRERFQTFTNLLWLVGGREGSVIKAGIYVINSEARAASLENSVQAIQASNLKTKQNTAALVSRRREFAFLVLIVQI